MDEEIWRKPQIQIQNMWHCEIVGTNLVKGFQNTLVDYQGSARSNLI
jgi:hypothetical protein